MKERRGIITSWKKCLNDLRSYLFPEELQANLLESFDEKLKGRIYAVDKHRKEVLVVKIEIKGETTYKR
jgi:hypothetical protein